jgi:hypothetical protein
MNVYNKILRRNQLKLLVSFVIRWDMGGGGGLIEIIVHPDR